MEKMVEMKLQAECVQWFWNTFPAERGCLFHVEQSAVNAIQGARNRSIGVVSGVSDLILVLRGRVVFIELKTTFGNSKQSRSQIVFQDLVQMRGHEYYVIRTLQEFQILIYRLLV